MAPIVGAIPNFNNNMTLPNLPFNSRILEDVNFIVTQSYNGGSNFQSRSAFTPALNLVQATPYPVTERIVVNIYSGQVLNSTGSANINVVLQDSADNSTFTNISTFANPIISLTPTGASQTSSIAQANVQLPPSVREYIRVGAYQEVSASAAGGPTGSFALTLFF